MGLRTSVPPVDRDLRLAADALSDPLEEFAAERVGDPVREAAIAPVHPHRWPAVLHRNALVHGYDFPALQIRSALREVVARFGEQEVTRTWETWCATAAEMGEDLAWINPRAFAARYGYWRQLAAAGSRSVPMMGNRPGPRLEPEASGNGAGSKA